MSARKDARFMWWLLAHKQADERTLDWLAEVARHILEADKLTGRERQQALSRALGLRGSHFPDDALRLNLVLNLLADPHPDYPGVDTSTAKAALDFVADRMGWHDLTPDAMNKRIDRALESFPADRRKLIRKALGRRRP
jgi:hypothetical protein